MLPHEPTEGRGICLGDSLGANLPGLPILDPHNGSLTRRAADSARALGLVLVRLLAAHEGLVHLNRAVEGAHLRFPCTPDTVREVPGRFLRDAEVAVQLHAGDALEIGGQSALESQRLSDTVQASTDVWAAQRSLCADQENRKGAQNRRRSHRSDRVSAARMGVSSGRVASFGRLSLLGHEPIAFAA